VRFASTFVPLGRDVLAAHLAAAGRRGWIGGPCLPTGRLPTARWPRYSATGNETLFWRTQRAPDDGQPGFIGTKRHSPVHVSAVAATPSVPTGTEIHSGYQEPGPTTASTTTAKPRTAMTTFRRFSRTWPPTRWDHRTYRQDPRWTLVKLPGADPAAPLITARRSPRSQGR
jgi:hypothetical protein